MSEDAAVSWLEGRDPEIEDVLQKIERLLAAGSRLRGTSRDAHFTLVEAIAAPYAIAFMLEIRRLDEAARKRRCER